MKHILIGILLLMVATSCYKDLGNYDYGTKTAIQIDSIKSSYTAYSGDTLRITPEVFSSREIVEYEWTVYDSLEAIAEVTVLGTEKDLNAVIILPQGLYQLLYKVTDIDGYTQIASTVVNVITTYSEGFYVLKEVEENNSDLDLYPTNTNPVQDVMLNVHERRMQGKPQDLFISPQHTYIDSIRCREFVMFPVTEEETMMLKVQDMSIVFNYEDFFYIPPTEKEQPRVFFYGGMFTRALLTDRNAYSYQTIVASVSGKYGDHAAYLNGNTAMEPAPFVAGQMTFYDNLNGQFLRMNEFNTLFQYRNAAPNGQAARIVPPYGLNCRMLYMRQTKYYALPSGCTTPYAVMENKDNGERYLFTLDATYLDYGTYNPIIKADTLPRNLHIYEAENFTLSENSIFLYYNVGMDLYCYDIQNKTETALNLNLEGEEICMLDYLFWLRGDQWSKFIVATHAGGQYKLYFFDTRGDQPNASITPTVYEGEGKPKAIHYVNPTAVNTNQYPYNG